MITQKNYNSYSTLLVVGFLASLILFTFYVEFFYSKNNVKKNQNYFDSPIKPDFLDRISTIKLKNKLGSFLLISKNNQWILEEPKKLPANLKTVKKVLDSLENISIRTLHPKDAINLQNFSLDIPLASLTLLTKLGESTTLDMGLINPVTNNTFIKIKDKNFIYEIAQLFYPIEQLELSDLIDTRIFNIELKDIKDLSITLYNHSDARNVFTQDGNLWSSKRYNNISQEKVVNTLSKILTVPPYLIIDSKSESISNYVDNYLKNPKFRIEITTKEGKSIQYRVSNITRSIDELKIDNKSHFIIKASNRPYPFLVHKDYLDYFLIKYNGIK